MSGKAQAKMLQPVPMDGNPFLSLFIGPVTAFLLVMALIPLARKLAIRTGFVDQPGGRKDHAEAVPPIGGLVLFPVYMLVALLAGANPVVYWPLYAALAVILIAGALDDYYHVSPWVKFIAQFIAAAIIVFPGHIQIYQLGNLFGLGDFGLGFMSLPFSIISVVLFINAINLMDGLDGLAGGKSFVVLFWLVLACLIGGDWYPVFAMLPLMGALAGFLFYNMRHPFRDKASVFLGDAGSMGLGLVLAWFCVSLAQDADPVILPISIAWVLALPIIDACGQFYRRVKEGRHPFAPDRGHFHHHFIHAGLPVGQSTAIILLIGFVLGGVGYVGVRLGVPEWALTLAWIALLFSHIALSRNPQNYIGFIERFKA